MLKKHIMAGAVAGWIGLVMSNGGGMYTTKYSSFVEAANNTLLQTYLAEQIGEPARLAQVCQTAEGNNPNYANCTDLLGAGGKTSRNYKTGEISGD